MRQSFVDSRLVTSV